MKIGVPKEQFDKRVALVPETIAKIKQLGVEVLIEKGAGDNAYFPDASFEEHATLVDRKTLLNDAELLVSVQPLGEEALASMPKDTHLLSMFQPYADDQIVSKLQKYGLNAFSMDMIPRTSRAQSMDVLSSMASLAGYRAVLLAANHLPRYFPMMITAAGSIRPAKVLVLGAGVAGLQAIATAKRLGAMVEAFDVRAAAKEEVESLGAKFVEVEGAKDDTSAGGYAVQQSEDFLRRQREEVQARATKSDAVITTAQVRGRKAPVLLTADTVSLMQPGSVVVDLAASTGGNCELTRDNENYIHKGVLIIGNSALAADMPQDASRQFSNNVLNFLKLIIKDGALHIDMSDDIVEASLITAIKKDASSTS